MRRLILLLFAFAGAGCSAYQATPMTPTGTTAAAAAAAGAAKQKVYWALFAAQPQPQLEIAAEPLTKKSHVQLINGSSGNMLQEASSIRFSQNFAWVLTQPDGSSAPSVLLIFSLPLTPSSKPRRRSHPVR